MKLSGRKFFQPLRSAWNPPIGDALKTCALVSPGSRRLTSIYIKSLRTCRLHGGDLCAEMFRKSPLRSPARPFSQKPPRTSFFNRHGPSGPSDFSTVAVESAGRQYRVVRRLLLPVAELRRSGRMTAGMATGWRIANPPQRISSATAVGLRLLQENDGHALRGAPPKALLARIRQLRHQQKRSPSNLSRLQICRIGLPGSPPQSEML